MSVAGIKSGKQYIEKKKQHQHINGNLNKCIQNVLWASLFMGIWSSFEMEIVVKFIVKTMSIETETMDWLLFINNT